MGSISYTKNFLFVHKSVTLLVNTMNIYGPKEDAKVPVAVIICG
jgi:hypothetical protein